MNRFLCYLRSIFPQFPSDRETSDFGLRTSDPDRRERRSAFTLIELIAVMGIIIALSLVVAGGYSGMARAMAEGQSTRQLRDSLLLARQNACVNGSRTYVYILSEDEYVICRKIGTSSGASSGQASYQPGKDPLFKKDAYVFYDFYTDLASFVNDVDRTSESAGQASGNSNSNYRNSDLSSSMLLFDLSADEAQYGILRGVESNEDLGFGWCLYWRTTNGESHNSKYFAEGHDYGIALYPVRSLPKGYIFLSEIGSCVYFEPTGMTGPGSGKHTFVVAEAAYRTDTSRQRDVTVDHSGKVTVEAPK